MADQILRIFERVCIGIAVLCLLFAIFRVWVMKDVRGPFARKEYYQLGDTAEKGYLHTEFAEKIKSDLSHDELISDLKHLQEVSDATGQAELQLIIDELMLDAATSTISATPVIVVPSPIPPAPSSATEPATIPTDVTPMSVAPPPFPATSGN